MSVFRCDMSSRGAWHPSRYPQVRNADCSIVYRLIVEGVPLWDCRRNLPLQLLTWSGVMSISFVIRILGCPVVDHLTIITRIDNIGKLYGQRLTYLHNLQGGYCMQNYIKPQSRKKYRRNSDFYNSWSTCHPTWRRVRWSISTAHARISREKSFCINYDNYV